MRGDDEGEDVGESEYPRWWRARLELEKKAEIVSLSSSVRHDMGEDINLSSVLKAESSDSVFFMGGGEALMGGESGVLMTGVTRTVVKLVIEARGLTTGVRRGDGCCSSSSSMGGESVRGCRSGSKLVRVGYTALGSESARRNGISSGPVLVSVVDVGTAIVNAVRGSISVDLRRRSTSSTATIASNPGMASRRQWRERDGVWASETDLRRRRAPREKWTSQWSPALMHLSMEE